MNRDKKSTTDTGKLKLVRPEIAHEKAFTDFVNEFKVYDEPWHRGYRDALDDFQAYVEKLRSNAAGINLPPGFVPEEAFFLLYDDTEICGMIRVRSRLTEALLEYGGNIAYLIKPSCRSRGFGAAMLSMALKELKKSSVNRARITCDSDNIGSIRVIEKNEGVLDSESINPATNKCIRRYWIDT